MNKYAIHGFIIDFSKISHECTNTFFEVNVEMADTSPSFMTEQLNILPFSAPNPTHWELLLVADPSKILITAYLENGYSFEAILQGQIVGVLVLMEVDQEKIEIKNIAIDPGLQRRGFGKQLLKFAEHHSRSAGYQKLLIGTGNSSLHQLALYQKMGFEVSHIVRDFFVKNYEEEIVENGIPCKHMIVLEKILNQDEQPTR